jgi:hypothetical protein
MFKLFNSEAKPKIIDKIFIHSKNKWSYCNKLLLENEEIIFIGWFDDTIDEFENYFLQSSARPVILKARTASRSQVGNMRVIFIEHYPMKTKEDQLLDQLKLKLATFLISADEPLLKRFGGDKLIRIMENLGMKEDDPIDHKLISQSIANAQKKIESKVFLDHSTRSQAEWMDRNFKR